MSRMVYIETIVFNGNNINERAKINSKITVHKNVFLAKLKKHAVICLISY